MQNRPKNAAPYVSRAERPAKKSGRVYTPPRLVRQILDLSGYRDAGILRKNVLENSCGDGAFLTEIVERYCQAFGDGRRADLKSELETYVHGIEIDPIEREKCVRHLDATARKFGLSDVRWDVLRADATTVARFDGQMDFVLGNPPYVRVHRLGESFGAVKKFRLAGTGMTDLYLAFYELGLNALKPGGTLGYITPSSFFGSLAGAPLRREFVAENLLAKLVDLKHFQAFDATTYTTIAVLTKNRAADAETEYFEYDSSAETPKFVARLRRDDYFFNDRFYFASRRRLSALKKILAPENAERGVSISVKNGFATLADSFFIGDDKARFGDEFSIPVVKASTGRRTRCLFPYSPDGTLLTPEKIAQNAELNEYYRENADALRRRSLTDADAWRGFGRTQGIGDVFRPKIAVGTTIRTASDLKIVDCPPGTGVYGGLYVLADAENGVSFATVKRTLKSKAFTNFVAALGKYKNGGYYAFSSKDLKIFLEYAKSQRRD